MATVTLTNNGSGPLTISPAKDQNGITENGISLPPGTSPFSIASITSSTQGAINVAVPQTLAARPRGNLDGPP